MEKEISLETTALSRREMTVAPARVVAVEVVRFYILDLLINSIGVIKEREVSRATVSLAEIGKISGAAHLEDKISSIWDMLRSLLNTLDISILIFKSMRLKDMSKEVNVV